MTKYFLTSCILFNTITALSSAEIWQEMQHHYTALQKALSSANTHFSEKELCHPYWQNTKANIQKIVQGSYNPDFLNVPAISSTMVRSGMTIAQEYELCFLNECVNDRTKKFIAAYRDAQFGKLPKECAAFQCSSNTLGHLFYAARTIELMDTDPKTIVEFGGGYGNLARIYSNCFPECTYLIIDLPELLALQYYFLKETMPHKKIIMHTHRAGSYESNAIHLIPVQYLHDMNCTCDLFISTFAITEASDISQDIIINKKFFNAPMVYITGQLNGWGSKMKFIHHNKLHTNLRKDYQYVDCHPFHLMLAKLQSYEVIAKNYKQ